MPATCLLLEWCPNMVLYFGKLQPNPQTDTMTLQHFKNVLATFTKVLSTRLLFGIL
jgi:hypothetical protein